MAFPSTSAAAPGPASGNIAQLSYIVAGFDTGGGGTAVYYDEMDSLTGTLSGVTALHGACKAQTSGRTTCRADGSFAGTVDGRVGSFFFTEAIDVDSASGAYSGRIGIHGSSGDLAGLHGHGMVQGVGPSGSYSLQISL